MVRVAFSGGFKQCKLFPWMRALIHGPRKYLMRSYNQPTRSFVITQTHDHERIKAPLDRGFHVEILQTGTHTSGLFSVLPFLPIMWGRPSF
jgi:hypothetical protein